MIRKIPSLLKTSILPRTRFFFSTDISDTLKIKNLEKQTFENYDVFNNSHKNHFFLDK